MASEHDHESGFISESLVQARVCKECGAYVSGRLLQTHVDFHESVRNETVESGEEQLSLFV